MRKTLYLTSCLVMASAGGALAGDYGAPFSAPNAFISELRMGVLSHDVARREQGSVDIQAEILFQPFGDFSEGGSFWDMILSPRPHIGGSVNSEGDTSYGYAGLSWLYSVWGPVFIEASFGGAIHDGNLNDTDPKREPLGTRALFRETASLGFDYQNYRVMVTVEHLSNAGLGDWNHGLTHVGGRVGYKF
ncbi:MAG: acyloxyacyl hydrolase [Cohaesibacter sp.]|nr:acyloxyacyl hydrolase [Cohaesibacter sp.]